MMICRACTVLVTVGLIVKVLVNQSRKVQCEIMKCCAQKGGRALSVLRQCIQTWNPFYTGSPWSDRRSLSPVAKSRPLKCVPARPDTLKVTKDASCTSPVQSSSTQQHHHKSPYYIATMSMLLRALPIRTGQTDNHSQLHTAATQIHPMARRAARRTAARVADSVWVEVNLAAREPKVDRRYAELSKWL